MCWHFPYRPLRFPEAVLRPSQNVCSIVCYGMLIGNTFCSNHNLICLLSKAQLNDITAQSKPQLKLGLTWKWLCKPTNHPTPPHTNSMVAFRSLRWTKIDHKWFWCDQQKQEEPQQQHYQQSQQQQLHCQPQPQLNPIGTAKCKSTSTISTTTTTTTTTTVTTTKKHKIIRFWPHRN